MNIICIKVVVKEMGGDESTERGSVHDEKLRTKMRALGNTIGGSILHKDEIITFNTEGAR